MKICWDNLEKVWLSKKGNLKIGHTTYIEMDSCKVCGEPYLMQKRKHISPFCGHSCSLKGRKHTIETIKKISESKINRKCKGHLSTNYKGGIYTAGLTVYTTYKDRLGLYEDIRKQGNTDILEVRCAYCGKWFSPKFVAVRHRLMAINNLNHGEKRLYCSENCKQACPTYGQRIYPKGFKHTSSREVNPHLRQMVFERDNWTCQICDKTVKEAQLHVHHMDPTIQNPMFQNDMNSCITLCKDCHKMIHKQYGCRYVDLRCKKETDYTKSFKDMAHSKI